MKIRGAWKERLPRQHLTQNTPGSPQVHRWTIPRGTEKQFGWPVPARHHTRGVMDTMLFLGTRKSKISNFQLTAVVDQQIGSFNVSVQDTDTMEILESS